MYLGFQVPSHNLIDRIYLDISNFNTYSRERQISFLQDRVILCPHNVKVDMINDSVLNDFPEEETLYLSADSMTHSDSSKNNTESDLPTEYLNTLNLPDIPLHRTVVSPDMAFDRVRVRVFEFSIEVFEFDRVRVEIIRVRLSSKMDGLSSIEFE